MLRLSSEAPQLIADATSNSKIGDGEKGVTNKTVIRIL